MPTVIVMEIAEKLLLLGLEGGDCILELGDGILCLCQLCGCGFGGLCQLCRGGGCMRSERVSSSNPSIPLLIV